MRWDVRGRAACLRACASVCGRRGTVCAHACVCACVCVSVRACVRACMRLHVWVCARMFGGEGRDEQCWGLAQMGEWWGQKAAVAYASHQHITLAPFQFGLGRLPESIVHVAVPAASSTHPPARAHPPGPADLARLGSARHDARWALQLRLLAAVLAQHFQEAHLRAKVSWLQRMAKQEGVEQLVMATLKVGWWLVAGCWLCGGDGVTWRVMVAIGWGGGANWGRGGGSDARGRDGVCKPVRAYSACGGAGWQDDLQGIQCSCPMPHVGLYARAWGCTLACCGRRRPHRMG